MKHSVSSRFSTSPLPAFLAACSRLMRWRSTRICLSREDRLSIVPEKAPFISGRASMAGRTNSSKRIRSNFLAQPGKAACFRLRASRTRLDITIRSCGPLRRALSAGGIRKTSSSMVVSARWGIGCPSRDLLDFIPQNGGLLEILLLDSLGELLLQVLEPIRQIATLPQRFRDFAHMPSPFVHGLEQAFQRLGESLVTLRAAQPPRLLEIRLGKTARRTLQTPVTAGLFYFLRSPDRKSTRLNSS